MEEEDDEPGSRFGAVTGPARARAGFGFFRRPGVRAAWARSGDRPKNEGRPAHSVRGTTTAVGFRLESIFHCSAILGLHLSAVVVNAAPALARGGRTRALRAENPFPQLGCFPGLNVERNLIMSTRIRLRTRAAQNLMISGIWMAPDRRSWGYSQEERLTEGGTGREVISEWRRRK